MLPLGHIHPWAFSHILRLNLSNNKSYPVLLYRNGPIVGTFFKYQAEVQANIIISDNSRREKMLRCEVDDGRRDIKRQKEREILRLYNSDVITN